VKLVDVHHWGRDGAQRTIWPGWQVEWAERENVSSNKTVGIPRRDVLAAAMLVLGLILVIVSFSWIDSPGLASSPGETVAPDGISLRAPGATEPDPDVDTERTDNAASGLEAEQMAGDSSAAEQGTSADGDDAPPPESAATTRKLNTTITAPTWVVISAESGERIAGDGIDTEVAIASTVKIVTALVVLEHADLDDEVTIEQRDLVDPMVHSNMMLMPGDTLTIEQLLQGLLISSGSDAGNALARYVGTLVGGDVDADSAVAVFVEAMNAYAEDLGLEHTQFANPSGDDDPESYSSAGDMATLGAKLMENEALAEMVGMAEYTFVSPGQGNTYTGFTTNQLLGEDGITGIKTGSTGDAGGCVILARETANGEVQIIAILGADLEYTENIITLDTRWNDARAIIASIDE
jgi:D-alanyl-D-alanine carboxypeptidase (penicillin-binding protein 5/6)